MVIHLNGNAGRRISAFLSFLLMLSQLVLSVANHRAAMLVQAFSAALLLLLIFLRNRLRISSFAVWYGVFALAVTLSCVFVTKAQYTKLLNVFQLLAVFLLLDQFVQDRRSLERVYHFYILCCLLLGGWLLYRQSVRGDVRLGTSVSESLPIWIGSFSSLACCFCILLSTQQPLKARRKRLYLLGALLCLLILMLTGSRKYYISVAASLFYYATNHNKGRWKRLLLVLAFSLVSVYLIYHTEKLYMAIGRRIDKLIQFTASHDIYDDKSAAVRERFISIALQEIPQKPLLGHGMWSWNQVTQFGTHPHNNYLDLLFSLGLIGFLLYYVYLAWLLFRIIRRKHSLEANIRYFYIINLCMMFVMDFFQRSLATDPVFFFFAFSFWELHRGCRSPDAPPLHVPGNIPVDVPVGMPVKRLIRRPFQRLPLPKGLRR